MPAFSTAPISEALKHYYQQRPLPNGDCFPAPMKHESPAGSAISVLDLSLAQNILEAVAPGHRVHAVVPAKGAFTNAVHILEARSPSDQPLRLVVKRMTESPDPRRAIAEFHALRIARKHDLPAPEPLLLDTSGETLGKPGLVTTFVEGEQITNPQDVVGWSHRLAGLLLSIHDINLDAKDKQHLYDGNTEGLYFLEGSWPEKKFGHPLSESIYTTIREAQHRVRMVPPAFLHMDFWQGNVLWSNRRISAVLDWDVAAWGDPAIDIGYFRMNMHLRGLKEAANHFLECYQSETGTVVHNLAFWELAAAARPLPDPAAWIPAFRKQDQHQSRAYCQEETSYVEFVARAIQGVKYG